MDGSLARRMLWVALAGALCFGCSGKTSGSGNSSGGSSGSGNNGNCTSIAGTWGVTGTCGADTCVVTQSGCNTNFSCGGGTHSYTGSVSGNSVSYAGQTAKGINATCSGTVNGASMSGTCSGAGATCTFAATRK